MSMNWNSPAHPEFLTTDNRRLPVNRIFCIAKNYEEHAKEMGGEVDRKAPFHFQKSFDALTFGPNVRYPSHTDDLHHEVACCSLGKEDQFKLEKPNPLSSAMQLVLISRVVIVRLKQRERSSLGNW